ncbi:MAG: valine--tRNA ligase [Candidatus Saccharimonadales bacterium]
MALEKNYEPQQHEADIYHRWEESGAFQPQGSGEPYTIIMPPPNANGSLHAGHASGYTLEDVLIRYHRMQGRRTLWLPGTDHAGIETQFVYERELAKAGKDRFDLGPEKFYAAVMEFTQASQGNMLAQMRAMGWSADWSKLKFTLDEDIIGTVYDTFIQMHRDGLVYRGNRIVNWCPRCSAAFADIELDHVDQEGKLYTLDYGSIQIATTRPETIFADTAVAVHPEDERYRDLVGQTATVPLVERPVAIIADKYVDPGAGTGALKVTPGHDPNDYEIGVRHQLAEISVIDPEGKLINVPEEFAGLDVGEGRFAVVAALEKAGKLLKQQSIQHAVAIHDRCGTTIEPLISEQWFLRVGELNRTTIKAIETDAITIVPQRFKKIALNWLEQEHDWCISRQIWWGIRIPVFYKTSNDPDKEPYLVAKTEAEATAYYGSNNYRAETDTFDTWFSSGQWPYATLMAHDLENEFYPTTVMATAREILHKWVTRMIMFGLYRTGEVPFKSVYLWGLVTDEAGQKMSKSKGNVLDPLELSQRYGTDALRMTMVVKNTPGNDSPLSEKQVEAYRNFCNKLWNVSRYTLTQLGNTAAKPPVAVTLADRWIYSRLQAVTAEIDRLVAAYRLDEAAQAIYHLLWSDFADWYLEAHKLEQNHAMLSYGLETILKLAHPIVPFITEAIWGELPGSRDPLITTSWPHPERIDQKSISEFNQLQSLISQIRTVIAETGETAPNLYYREADLLDDNAALVSKLAGLESCTRVTDGRGLPIPGTPIACWLDVDEHTIARYRQKLEASLKETQAQVAGFESKLDNKAYRRNAPKEIVKETRVRLKAAQMRLQTLSEQLKDLDQ